MRANSAAISAILLTLSLTAGSAAQSSPGQESSTAQADTSTPASSDSGKAFASPRIQPSDYLAPLSTMRWGPFSVNSIDTQGTWSNTPLGLNGETNPQAQLAGIGTPGPSYGSHSSASMTARWRWGKGFIGILYTPSVDYQSAVGQRLINHNISAFIDHPFQFGRWRMTVGLHSATTNTYSPFFDTPSIQPLLDLNVPITTRDLLGLLNDPAPLQPVSPQTILLSHHLFSAQASAALSRQLSGRNTLSITASYIHNQILDFGNGSGTLFNYPQLSGFTLKATVDHLISSRSSWAVSLQQSQAVGGSYGANMEQSLLFTYTWRPWRRLGFSLGGGPARTELSDGRGTYFRPDGMASVAFTIPGGAVLTASYRRGFDLQGFAGGQNANNFNVTLGQGQAPLNRNGRLGKWRYTFTTNIQLASGVGQYNGVGATLGTGLGFTLSASYPVTTRMAFITNYGYFFQDVTNATNFSSLQHYQRSVVSAGLRYTFNNPNSQPNQQRY